jgi:hypothetical protein
VLCCSQLQTPRSRLLPSPPPYPSCPWLPRAGSLASVSGHRHSSNNRFRLRKRRKNARGLNEERMLNLMSRLLCRREKISLLPPFSLRKDFGQTKEGMPLGALKLMEGAMRQFSVGEVVTFIPDWILRSAAPGDYKIVSSMPDRDGDHMYRVKSPLEEHERVVRENLLVKSDGCLPDEFVRQRSHRRSITLPSLKQLEVRLHLEPITSMPS